LCCFSHIINISKRYSICYQKNAENQIFKPPDWKFRCPSFIVWTPETKNSNLFWCRFLFSFWFIKHIQKKRRKFTYERYTIYIPRKTDKQKSIGKNIASLGTYVSYYFRAKLNKLLHFRKQTRAFLDMSKKLCHFSHIIHVFKKICNVLSEKCRKSNI